MRRLNIPDDYGIILSSGVGQLPIFELDRKDVEESRGSSIRHALATVLGRESPTQRALKKQGHSILRFGMWPLIHSMKKTELAGSFTRGQVEKQAYGLAFEYEDFFVWNTTNFRIRRDGHRFFKDASRTNAASRCGEGLANLYMYEQGYRYWDHVPSLLRRAIERTNVLHPESVRKTRLNFAGWKRTQPSEEPEFIYENNDRESALLESKGSILKPTSRLPDVKGRLRKALRQVGAWKSCIQPAPKKSYAFGAFLREENDASGSSFIAFVDPILFFFFGWLSNDNERMPEDWIRRGNYGAWLIGMGLEHSGECLRRGIASQTREWELPVLELPQGKFAFMIGDFAWEQNSPVSVLQHFRTQHELSDEPWTHRNASFAKLGPGVLITGLHLDALKRVEMALKDGEDRSLLTTEPPELQADSLGRDPFSVRNDELGFAGSVLPDGTLFGFLSLERGFPQFPTHIFEL